MKNHSEMNIFQHIFHVELSTNCNLIAAGSSHIIQGGERDVARVTLSFMYPVLPLYAY